MSFIQDYNVLDCYYCCCYFETRPYSVSLTILQLRGHLPMGAVPSSKHFKQHISRGTVTYMLSSHSVVPGLPGKPST